MAEIVDIFSVGSVTIVKGHTIPVLFKSESPSKGEICKTTP
jgi:hypothetical protein